jgi:hypothetical protein
LIAVKRQFDHVASALGDNHLGVFGLFRKRANPIHLILNILGQALDVLAFNYFNPEAADAFPGRGSDFLDPFEALDGFLDGQYYPPLDFLLTGAGIGQGNIDPVQIEVGEYFFFDLADQNCPANQKDQH